MIDHLYVYATDYMATKSFYEEVFEPLGYALQEEMVAVWNSDFPTQRRCAFGLENQRALWIIEVMEPATPAHIAFVAKTREQVDEFYQLAIQHGGIDNGAPALRSESQQQQYGALVFDPDGNDIEAVCLELNKA